VFAARGKSVPVIALVAPLLVLTGAISAAAAWPVGDDPDAARAAVAASAGGRLLGFAAGGLVGAVLIGGHGLLGAAKSPRSWGAFAAAASFAALTAAVTVAGGVVEEDLVFPTLRGAMYAMYGLTAAAGALAGPVDGAGRRSAIAAAALFPLVVAFGEAASMGLVDLQLLLHLSSASPDVRGAFATQAFDEVKAPMAAWSWGSVGASVGVAAVGAVEAVRRSPRRVEGAAVAAIAALAALCWWSLGPDAADLVRAAGASTP
jgi:hypothetical protein